MKLSLEVCQGPVPVYQYSLDLLSAFYVTGRCKKLIFLHQCLGYNLQKSFPKMCIRIYLLISQRIIYCPDVALKQGGNAMQLLFVVPHIGSIEVFES